MSLETLTAPLKNPEDLDAGLKEVLRLARVEVGAERGCMLVTRSGHEHLHYDGDEKLRLKFPFSRNVVGEVMAFGTGLVSFGSEGGADVPGSQSMALYGVRAALCAPILGRGDRDFGVIYFDTTMDAEPFTKEQLELIQSVGLEIGRVLS